MPFPTRFFRVLLAFVLPVAAVLVLTAPAAASDARERLRRENESLKHMVELASGKQFYLVLDAQAKVLRLSFQGVSVREIQVSRIAVGRPRVFFVSRPLPHDWKDGIWEKGTLDPLRVIPRRIMVPPDPDSALVETETEIPPLPEELVPAPDHYVIRFEGERVVEIVSPGGKRNAGDKAKHLMRGLGRALWPWGGDRVRVRLYLSAPDAGALYRSIPDTTRFKLL